MIFHRALLCSLVYDAFPARVRDEKHSPILSVPQLCPVTCDYGRMFLRPTLSRTAHITIREATQVLLSFRLAQPLTFSPFECSLLYGETVTLTAPSRGPRVGFDALIVRV